MLTAILTIILVLLIVNRFINKTKRNETNDEIELLDSIEEKFFTPKTLEKYNGVNNKRILIAVNKKVFDVTKGKSFYGPGGTYENFAGKDASRGLAKNSFSEDVIISKDNFIDNLKDLTDLELEVLNSWDSFFETKYTIVGQLVQNLPSDCKSESPKDKKDE